MRSTFRAALAVAIPAAFLAGCGGGSSGKASGGGTKSAKEWVSTFCTDAQTWGTSVKNASSSVDAQINNSGGDVATVKQALVKVLNDSVSATDTLLGQLEANGAPDVANGQKIQDAVLGAFRDGRTVFADALAKAQATSTDDPKGFVDTAKQLSSSITSGFDAVGKAFTDAGKLDSDGAIDKAAKDVPSCKALSG